MLSLGDVLQLNNRNWTVVGPLPGGVGGFGTVYVVEDEDGYEVGVAHSCGHFHEAIYGTLRLTPM